MKLYRYYTSKNDQVNANYVWFYTNVNDAAWYNGVVLKYEVDQNLLKPVPDDLLKELDIYEDPNFPNQSMLGYYKELGYNCYYLRRKNYGHPDISVCIFDKTLIGDSRQVTNDEIFILSGTMGGYLCRNVDNDTFTDACFAPASLYEKWKKNLGFIPSADDLFYGYIDDDIFFNSSKEEFEKYVYDNCYHE